ncbi:MAG TPA: hypothetical protein VN717_02870 [Gemmatimonadaceae bacterium]|nr:hypothetical protein [Gemmatimonadaceae bacterium]
MTPATDDDDILAKVASGYASPSSAARDFAVDLVKLFITFATAGIAFLVGGAFSERLALPPWLLIACLVLFTASVLCGIFFFMVAVSGLEAGTFIVTAPGPSKIAALQFFLFFFAAILLGLDAIARAGAPVAPPVATMQIDIHASAGRWAVDTAGGISIHKDRGAKEGGASSLRLRATSDGLTLRVELDTAGSRASAAPLRP